MTEKEAINVLTSLSIDVGGMHYPELRKYEHAIEEIICLLLAKVPPTLSELEEAYDNGYRAAEADFHKPAQQWIHVKYRPMDDEERKDYEEIFGPLADDEAVMFDCKMPQDGQEVWVCSKCGDVWQDTCRSDEGIYLEENWDWLDIVAWMPYIRPEPWRGDADDI